ncbi:MAG: hypothetical protein J7L47_06850 [Candidatus Odinarchaeota archaeon]|nr:hypothetical protein [Candidatus Odinarchaeota archaeon]
MFTDYEEGVECKKYPHVDFDFIDTTVIFDNWNRVLFTDWWDFYANAPSNVYVYYRANHVYIENW